MVMAVATTSASHLASFISTSEISGLSRSLQWPQRQRWCTRKPVHQTISASIDLKPPPYPLDALEPHMSKSTLEYHWGKHHRAYVNNLNNQIKDTELDEKSLESIILASYNNGDLLPTFNNAAQIWNHDFFWESMKPNGGGKPSGELLELIERDFGSFEGLINELKSAAATQFGSGWAWLVYKEHKLAVLKTTNAINPLVLEYHIKCGFGSKGLVPKARMAASNGFMHNLSMAACEWFLMFLMLIDAVLGFILTKFAHHCELQTPCLFCTRLDHVFSNENSSSRRTPLFPTASITIITTVTTINLVRKEENAARVNHLLRRSRGQPGRETLSLLYAGKA